MSKDGREHAAPVMGIKGSFVARVLSGEFCSCSWPPRPVRVRGQALGHTLGRHLSRTLMRGDLHLPLQRRLDAMASIQFRAPAIRAFAPNGSVHGKAWRRDKYSGWNSPATRWGDPEQDQPKAAWTLCRSAHFEARPRNWAACVTLPLRAVLYRLEARPGTENPVAATGAVAMHRAIIRADLGLPHEVRSLVVQCLRRHIF